ncbi:peptidylprolyl isomerase [Chloroflexota bacterium]
MSTRILLLVIGVILSVAAVSCGGSAPEKEPAEGIKTYDSPPAMTIDASKQYTAIIKTEKGDMVIELFAKDVPRTVNNFVFLAREGFYNSSPFHRVLPGFMAQGGDPTGTGYGGPGYTFKDEFTSHKHSVGTLSMANGGPDTNGSQFFITFTPQPGLDGKHTVFGQLIEGKDVLESLKLRDPSQNPSFEGDKIIKIVIEEK